MPSLYTEVAALGQWPAAERLRALRRFIPRARIQAVLPLPDSPANARVFGRPGGGRSSGAFPQARVLALCEAGTHVLWRTQVKPCRRGELTMAPALLRHLRPGMLLLWDRNFLSYRN